MKLPNKVYDILKWIVLVVIPCLTTAYVGLAAIWGSPFIYPDKVAKTSAVVCSLIGGLIGVSTISYNNQPPEGDEESNG